MSRNESSTVRVTVQTLTQLAEKSVRSCEGVQDVTVKTKNGKSGLRFRLALTLLPEQNIPELIERVQNTLKADMEATTGMTVEQVSVFVDNQMRHKS